MNHRSSSAARIALIVVATSLACAPDGVAPAGGPQFHDGVGTVVDIVDGKVLIDHDDIPGFMDAMTMTFPVAEPSLLEGLEPGARVEFRVKVEDRSYVIDRIARE